MVMLDYVTANITHEAVLIRQVALHKLCHPRNAAVTRTYLGEIVNETNEARGFGFLALCYSIGHRPETDPNP